ncbi:hypothetical protein B0H11DRAFT_173403 [Mycena galericulata]|nr:hypothetical protein B0H11DRAFT_173403 [Mycena galericulata]
MVVNLTHILWFSYGPFHAGVGILTTLLNLRKATAIELVTTVNGYRINANMQFRSRGERGEANAMSQITSGGVASATFDDMDAESRLQFCEPSKMRGTSIPAWPM